jgi:hypothetical protein
VSRQIDLFRQTFRRNILLIDFRLIAADPLGVLTAIEQFIAIPAYFAASGVQALRLNSRTERSMGPAEWLMTREPVLGILGSIVPSRVMAGLRQRYERGMATTEDDKPAESSGQRALAERVFGEDRRLVSQIFASAPIVLGDGQPFLAQARSPERMAMVRAPATRLFRRQDRSGPFIQGLTAGGGTAAPAGPSILGKAAGHAAVVSLRLRAAPGTADRGMPVFLLMGVLHYHMIVAIHEAIHRTLFSNNRLNDAAGDLLGGLALANFDSVKKHHLSHHQLYGRVGSRSRRVHVFDPLSSTGELIWRIFKRSLRLTNLGGRSSAISGAATAHDRGEAAASSAPSWSWR